MQYIFSSLRRRYMQSKYRTKIGTTCRWRRGRVWVARIGGEPWGSRGSGSDKCGFSIDASDQSPLGYSLLSFL
jgi:hypothetical protein